MVDAIDSKSILGCQGAGSSPVIGKLLFFDFDGLLVNTEHLHQEAYQEAFQKWKCPLDLDFFGYAELAHHVSGTKLKEEVQAIYPHTKDLWSQIRKDKMAIYSRLLETKIELMPFVEEFLYYIKEIKIPMCVVTNSTKEDTLKVRSHLKPLNIIPNWITRECYEKPKPAPDSYLVALNLFPNIKPSETIGFEDTLKGIEALTKAKVHPILICDPNHPQLKDAKNICTFPSFKGIKEHIKFQAGP